MSTKRAQGIIRHLAWIVGFATLAVFVVVAWKKADPERLVELVRHASATWLTLAALLQIGTYLCAAAVIRIGVGSPDGGAGLIRVAPLGLMKIFVDQAVPTAGAGGTMLIVRALRKRGVSTRAATRAVVAGLFAFYVAYALSIVVSLGILWLGRGLRHNVLVWASAAGLVLVALPALLVWLAWLAKHPPRWLRRIPVVGAKLPSIGRAAASAMKDRRLLAADVAFQFLIFVFDAATLYAVLRALDRSPPVLQVFASFVLASVAATLSVLPGGVGVFEGGSVLMLRFIGEPLEVAVAATLLFRGLTLWLPMLPGFFMARRVMAGGSER